MHYRNKINRLRHILIWTTVFLIHPGSGRGQSQAAKQLMLDWEKLAGFRSILQDMYSGYQAMDTGYQAIIQVEQATYLQQAGHIDSLMRISPAVNRDQDISLILLDQRRIIGEYMSTRGTLNHLERFSRAELGYLKEVYANLLSHCRVSLDELQLVLQPGQLSMTDAERLAGINRISREMADRLDFLKAFDERAILLARQRTRGKSNAGVTADLYGIIPQ